MEDELKTVDEWGQLHNIRILKDKSDGAGPVDKRIWNKPVSFQEFSDMTSEQHGFEARHSLDSVIEAIIEKKVAERLNAIEKPSLRDRLGL